MEIESESELFEPVKKAFEKLGFEVYGEINDCDIAAVKEDMLVVAELKRQFSLRLIYQAMERKVITENVYVAVPRPKNFKDKSAKGMLRLLKEINIGLITVFYMGDELCAQIVSSPEPLGKEKKSKKRNKLLKEINGRMLNSNQGGISKKKILTAYKEKSIFLLCMAEKFGTIRLRALKENSDTAELCGVLMRNYDKWFDKCERGVYAISEKGKEILESGEYAEAFDFYRRKAEEIYLREEKENV